MPLPLSATVTFDQIKNRKVAQYELTDIIMDLAIEENGALLDRWRSLSPKSFEKLDFTKAYLLAANRSLEQRLTNQALSLYIRSFQWIDKNYYDKVEAAFQASFHLYAQNKRSEALFYINRAIESLAKIRNNHPLAEDLFFLKRRIVWRYFSRFESLPDNAISAVEFDGDDVWIGMWSGGVGRFSRSSLRLDLYNERNTKLPSNYTRDILVRKDKIWVATQSGLAYYQKSDASWHPVKGLEKYKFKNISHNGTHFYATTLYKGVFRSKDGDSWENIISGHSVLDILNIGNEFYIATPERGVYLYRDNKLEPFLPNVSAKVIISDRDPNILWVGTYGQGLLKIDRKSAKILEEFRANVMRSDYVESLLVEENKLWVGTLETGVSIYDMDEGTWSILGLRDGLPGLDITSITRENDHLWFGTLAGGIGIYLFKEKFPVKE